MIIFFYLAVQIIFTVWNRPNQANQLPVGNSLKLYREAEG
jgi:hypothetical protein